MTESLWHYFALINEQEQNLTTERLKICFDNIVHELNALEGHDVNIQSVGTIATNLFNINEEQLHEIIILEHPFLFILRDLTIELLQKKTIVIIKLITLFTKFYSKINDDNLSKLHILVFHQPLLDVFVH
jgi:uncharacterized protein YxjI